MPSVFFSYNDQDPKLCPYNANNCAFLKPAECEFVDSLNFKDIRREFLTATLQPITKKLSNQFFSPLQILLTWAFLSFTRSILTGGPF